MYSRKAFLKKNQFQYLILNKESFMLFFFLNNKQLPQFYLKVVWKLENKF